MITVWQRCQPTFRPSNGERVRREDFLKVAEVNTDVPEQAYQSTQHITCSWCENQEITWHAPRGLCRSTSVGDVLELGDGSLLEVDRYVLFSVEWERVAS